MSTRTLTLDDDVQQILARSTVSGSVLTLPEQLPRPLYEKVAKAIKAMGGKWDRKAGGHVFPFDPSELLGGAVEDGKVVNRQKTLQFFETPPALAERMVAMATDENCRVVLEPSAGHGAIAAFLCRGARSVYAVEIDPTNAKVLRDRVPELTMLVEGDFLEWASHSFYRFDAIVMNPPFADGQDVDHIRAAYDLLYAGGKIAALCSESPFFRDTQSAIEFRAWLQDHDAAVEKLPPGTFTASGSGVQARLISMEA